MVSETWLLADASVEFSGDSVDTGNDDDKEGGTDDNADDDTDIAAGRVRVGTGATIARARAAKSARRRPIARCSTRAATTAAAHALTCLVSFTNCAEGKSNNKNKSIQAAKITKS